MSIKFISPKVTNAVAKRALEHQAEETRKLIDLYLALLKAKKRKTKTRNKKC